MRITIFFSLLVLLAGCATATETETVFYPADITPQYIENTKNTEAESSKKEPKIHIYVTPLYDSNGPEINVGKYSKGLKTSNLNNLRKIIGVMKKNKTSLRPEQMFVAAIRLYEFGDKDESIYWFYEAQVRARLFSGAIDQKSLGGMGSRAFELRAAYGAFFQLAGPVINGYAGCNLDNWIAIIKSVQKNNASPPDLNEVFPEVKFISRDNWADILNEVTIGMSGLIEDIEKDRSTFKQQRAANKVDEKYCN